MDASARFARAPQAGVAPAVVTRRPILDPDEHVVAFELLTRPDANPREGAAVLLSQAMADIGLGRLAGNRPVHVRVARELLLAVRPLPFASERVVLEVDAGRPADDLLLLALREAREQGFQVALVGGRSEELLALADMIKLDAGEEDLAGAVADAHGRGLAAIAVGVHTRDDYAACRELGFDAFQGAYFAEPAVVSGASAPTYRLRALSLLAAHEATSFEQLERVISEDPGLALKLVKLANSAYFGGREPVGTIHQALLALGSVAVRRWATLLTLAGATDRPAHLLELGLLRARLCELVAQRTPAAEGDRAFTVGLFSIADSLLGTRMPALLADLPFDDRTTAALAAHDGPEGHILAGVLAYERGDFEGCAARGVSLMDIARAFAEALDWTNGALAQLTA
jgi:EAL and modified HD-GYP domain-containing signal transduction protein